MAPLKCKLSYTLDFSIQSSRASQLPDLSKPQVTRVAAPSHPHAHSVSKSCPSQPHSVSTTAPAPEFRPPLAYVAVTASTLTSLPALASRLHPRPEGSSEGASPAKSPLSARTFQRLSIHPQGSRSPCSCPVHAPVGLLPLLAPPCVWDRPTALPQGCCSTPSLPRTLLPRGPPQAHSPTLSDLGLKPPTGLDPLTPSPNFPLSGFSLRHRLMPAHYLVRSPVCRRTALPTHTR